MADFDGTSAANKKRAGAGGRSWGLGDDDSSNDNSSNEDESGSTVRRSKLRDDAAMAASEWGERYASTKVSRRELKAGSTDKGEGNDDDEDISSEDVEEADDSENIENEEVKDEEDDEESEEDLSDQESEDSNESDEDASTGPKQASVFAGVGADNVDAQLAALAAEDRGAATTGGKTAQVGGGSTSGQGEGMATTDQRQRAQNAKALLALYDSVFEFRIAQQAAVHATNELPAPSQIASMLAPPTVEKGGNSDMAAAAGTPSSKKRKGSKVAENGVIAGTATKASDAQVDSGAAAQGQEVAMREASQQLQSTLQHLCALREDLRAARQKRGGGGSIGGGPRSEAPVDCAPKSSKRRCFDENGDEEKGRESEEGGEDDNETGDGAATKDCLLSGYSEDVDDENAEDRVKARALALESTWDGVAAGFERSKPFWEATLDQWQRRAQVCYT